MHATLNTEKKSEKNFKKIALSKTNCPYICTSITHTMAGTAYTESLGVCKGVIWMIQKTSVAVLRMGIEWRVFVLAYDKNLQKPSNMPYSRVYTK